MTTQEYIQHKLDLSNQEINKEIERLQSNKVWFAHKVRTLQQDTLPVIHEVLSKLKLELTEINFHNNGAVEGSLSLSFVAKPIGDKFKFISFKGYDSRGRGKNNDQLTSKAEKIEQSFPFRVSVNKYSLEDNATGRLNREVPNSVLFSMSI